MPVISVTRARVRRWPYRPLFLLLSFRIGFEARHRAGNLSVKMLWDRHGTFWTCTSWESEAALIAFLHAGSHARAMRKLPIWCDEAAFTRWHQTHSDPPSWEEAHRRLQQEGRTVHVDQPSSAHLHRLIAGPVVRVFHHVRLK